MNQLRNWSWLKRARKKDITDFYEKLFLLERYKKNGHTKFLTISKSTFSYAEKVLPKKYKQDIFLIPNAIKLSRFSNLKKSRRSDQIRLVNVGSLISLKNQSFLFKVVKELKLINKRP